MAIPDNPQFQVFKDFYCLELILGKPIVGISGMVFYGSRKEYEGHILFGERSSPLMDHHRLEATGYDFISRYRSISYEVSLFCRSPILFHRASIPGNYKIFSFQ